MWTGSDIIPGNGAGDAGHDSAGTDGEHNSLHRTGADITSIESRYQRNDRMLHINVKTLSSMWLYPDHRVFIPTSGQDLCLCAQRPARTPLSGPGPSLTRSDERPDPVIHEE